MLAFEGLHELDFGFEHVEHLLLIDDGHVHLFYGDGLLAAQLGDFVDDPEATLPELVPVLPVVFCCKWEGLGAGH